MTDCLRHGAHITHLPPRIREDCLRAVSPVPLPRSPLRAVAAQFQAFLVVLVFLFYTSRTSFSSAPLTAQLDTFHIEKVLWEERSGEMRISFPPRDAIDTRRQSQPHWHWTSLSLHYLVWQRPQGIQPPPEPAATLQPPGWPRLEIPPPSSTRCSGLKPSSLRKRDAKWNSLSSPTKRQELTSSWGTAVGTSFSTVLTAKAARGQGVAAWPMWLVAEVCCPQCSVGTASMSGQSTGCQVWGHWGDKMMLLRHGLLLESQNHAQPLPQNWCWAVLTCMTNAKRGFMILDFIKCPSSSPNLSLCLLLASWGELPPLPQGPCT